MYLSKAALLSGSTTDSCENPSSSTKQISWPSGSANMITRTVALPGVSSVMSGVKIVLLLSLIRWSISSWTAKGTANAIRPYALARLIGTSEIHNIFLDHTKARHSYTKDIPNWRNSNWKASEYDKVLAAFDTAVMFKVSRQNWSVFCKFVEFNVVFITGSKHFLGKFKL